MVWGILVKTNDKNLVLSELNSFFDFEWPLLDITMAVFLNDMGKPIGYIIFDKKEKTKKPWWLNDLKKEYTKYKIPTSIKKFKI